MKAPGVSFSKSTSRLCKACSGPALVSFVVSMPRHYPETLGKSTTKSTRSKFSAARRLQANYAGSGSRNGEDRASFRVILNHLKQSAESIPLRGRDAQIGFLREQPQLGVKEPSSRAQIWRANSTGVSERYQREISPLRVTQLPLRLEVGHEEVEYVLPDPLQTLTR